MSYLFFGLMLLFLFLCIIMILLVLIQKGRGGGLSGAFGGGGGNTAFGTKTGDVLTWATSSVFAFFILFAIALNLLANRIGNPPPAAPIMPPIPTGAAAPNSAAPANAGAGSAAPSTPAPTAEPPTTAPSSH